MNMDQGFYTITEIRKMRMLPFSKTEIRRLIKGGRLKAVNVGKKTVPRYAVSAEELRRYASTLTPAV